MQRDYIAVRALADPDVGVGVAESFVQLVVFVSFAVTVHHLASSNRINSLALGTSLPAFW